ncbi:ABC transporter ATP-binding protein [Candidatus Shapirobacteria bacterium]|nr:ABC transporter ATP-binding protein [Candidatus Shapirobacteria bacterium]
MNHIYKIIKLSRPLHGWIITAAILIVLQSILQLSIPVVLKNVVDELSVQISQKTGDYSQLFSQFTLILVINLVVLIFSSFGQRLGDFIASRLGRYLTEVYYRKIFTLPQHYFDSEVSGKMVNQLSRGITSIKDFVGMTTNFIGPSLLQATFGVILLSYYNLTIGLLAFSVFPVYIAISSFSTYRWGLLQKEKNLHEDATRGRIAEVISNIKLVKTYNTQVREWRYTSDQYQTINKIYDRQSTQYHLYNFARGFVLEIAFVSILYLIFKNTFIGVLTLGEMVLIIQVLNMLRWPLYAMSMILERIRQAEADSKAFFEVLDLSGTEAFQIKPLKKLSKTPQITFEHISFAYDKANPVLTDVSLSFDKNETVALVGHSGGGKTTLINLILKLYEPASGRIKLSGKSYAHVNHSWVREHMALVFQDNELFSSTIRENVAYGVNGATDDQIIKALKDANAFEFVTKFKDGLDSQIGERGVKLSGGQKQRIQIARAILHNKPILILDEATSSLDSRSEHLVQDALEKLFKNHLTIIIAHRFSTIQNVDRIIVLDQGTIVDSGTPAELSRRPGLYSELLQYQIAGNKKLLSKYEIY